MKGYRKRLGDAGEQAAANYLAARGYEIICRNYRAPGGELDLVAHKDGVTIFVEVKTRTSAAYGTGAEAVTSKKKTAMLAAAQHYACAHGLWDTPLRMDVIEITLTAGKCAVRHIQNAVEQ